MSQIININAVKSSAYDLKSKASQQPQNKVASNKKQNDNEITKTESFSVTVKKQLNNAILNANLDASVSAGNQPMSLLYKVAIEEINIALEGELGKNAIQNAYDSELDVGPSETADRIVSMSTAFFTQYRDQNPDMTDSEAATKFASIIGVGIDTGFSEARDLLDGLKVLEGGVADNIDATYDRVKVGLKAFVDSFKEEEKIESEDKTQNKEKKQTEEPAVKDEA